MSCYYLFYKSVVVNTIICECGELIRTTFRAYIKTSVNPSTSTIGCKKCGYIFNFIDIKITKKYSSKIELKSIAMSLAEKNNLESESVGRFLVEVDRLKSKGNLSDRDVLVTAFQMIINKSK